MYNKVLGNYDHKTAKLNSETVCQPEVPLASFQNHAWILFLIQTQVFLTAWSCGKTLAGTGEIGRIVYPSEE